MARDRRGSRSLSRGRLPLLLAGLPLLALFALDRAIVAWDPLWTWSAREVPREAWAPLRVEGLLRTTPAGRVNLLLLGNSSADFGIDPEGLAKRLLPREYRVVNLTVPGTRPTQYAMLAPEVAALDAGVAVLVTDASALSDRDLDSGVWAYDLRSALTLFSAREILEDPIFQLRGFANQVHVLSRHRRTFQDAALVALGFTTWDERHGQIIAARRARDDEDEEEVPWIRWFRGEVLVEYPNLGQRSIAYLADSLDSRGTRLFVVESPANPIIAISYARTRAAKFREQMAAHGAAHGYGFIGAPELGELEVDDFDDMIHLNPVGRQRFTAQLAAALAARLPAP